MGTVGTPARVALTAGSVALACTLLSLVGAPSPLLFGGLLGALLPALASLQPPDLPRPVHQLAQATIGVGVAAQVDRTALGAFAADAPAILLVAVATLVVSVLGGQLLRLHGVSGVTAAFASIAGGASGMTALSRDLGADDRVVTVVQYLRVLVVLVTLPLVVTLAFPEARTADVPAVRATGAGDLLFVVLAGGVGTYGGRLARLPSPAVLGSLLVGAALVLSGLFPAPVVPGWVLGAGFLLVGAQVGLRFTRASLAAIGRMLPTALVSIAVTTLACAGLGLLLAELTGATRLDAYLAATPGGLPAVVATATGTGGSDVTFVTAVQLVRLLMVLLLAPLVARLLGAGRPAEDDGPG